MKLKVVNFQAHRISGWFYDPAVDQTKSTLDLVVNGHTVDTLTCEIFRGELSATDFHTRNIGFLGTLPPQYWTGENYEVSLIHRGSGTVVAQQTIPTENALVDEEHQLRGNVLITAEGQVAGWAAEGSDVVDIRLLVDEEEVQQAPADWEKLPWKRGRIELPAPFHYLYAAQLPGEIFDDDDHRVEVYADTADGTRVRLLSQDLALAAAHRDLAAAEVARIEEGRPDRTTHWTGAPPMSAVVHVHEVTYTPAYATVTLRGETGHRRATLRMGEDVAVLHALEPESPAAPAQGSLAAGHATQLYAGELPGHQPYPEQLALYTPGADLASTYDLRLGEETGKRPQDLPEQVTEDLDGTFYCSPATLDGGVLTGYAVHTAAANVPVAVVLQQLTHGEVRELARTEANQPNAEATARLGVQRCGYELTLPAEALHQTSHLRLVADSGRGVETVWEDPHFDPSDARLLELALQAESNEYAIALLRNAHTAQLAPQIRALREEQRALATRLEQLTQLNENLQDSLVQIKNHLAHAALSQELAGVEGIEITEPPVRPAGQSNTEGGAQ